MEHGEGFTVKTLIKEIDEYLKQYKTGMPMTCYHPTILLLEAKRLFLVDGEKRRD